MVAKQPAKSPWRNFAWGLLWCTAGLVSAATVAGFLGRVWWRFELACHFRVQYFWLLIACTLVLLAAKRYRKALVTGIFASVNLALVVPLLLPGAMEGGGGGRLRVVSLNVHSSNRQHGKVLDFIEASSSDLVVLVEVDPVWEIALAPLRDRYPFEHVVAQPGNFGIGLYSRHPLNDVRVKFFGTSGAPSLVAAVDIDGQRLTVVATHPVPPMGRDAAHYRNSQLHELGSYVSRAVEPVVVLGDLNVTSWSPHFRDLLCVGGLKDSRRGFGVQASWPVQLPWTRIPLDHCLVSPDVKVLHRELGRDVGSDHFPVVVDLELSQQ